MSISNRNLCLTERRRAHWRRPIGKGGALYTNGRELRMGVGVGWGRSSGPLGIYRAHLKSSAFKRRPNTERDP